jgi:hypothetical protein
MLRPASAIVLAGGMSAIALTACMGEPSTGAAPQAALRASIFANRASSKTYPIDKPLLFVADQNNSRVYVFPHDGSQLIASIDVPVPHGIAVSSSGALYVASYGENAIEVYPIGSTKPAERITFSKPTALFVDPKNDLYADSAETGTLVEYPYDQAKRRIATTPSLTITELDLPETDTWQPFGISMDIAGNLYVADDGAASPCGCLWELGAGKKASHIHPVLVQNSTTVLESGQSLAVVDVSGRFVGGRLYNTFYIGALPANGLGGPIGVFLPTQSSPQYQLQGPYGATYMTTAANGDMYVSDGAGSNAVYAFHPHAQLPFETLTNYKSSPNGYFSTTDGVATWK